MDVFFKMRDLCLAGLVSWIYTEITEGFYEIIYSLGPILGVGRLPKASKRSGKARWIDFTPGNILHDVI